MDLSDVDQNLDLGLHFTPSQIVASLLFSIIGWYVFKHGKKTINYPVLWSGVGMMIYPLFTSGPLQDWGVGIILCGVAYYFNENAGKTG